MLKRQLERKLHDMAGKFPVIYVTGPRQSGKTTLCRSVFSNYRYVTLENPDSLNYATSDPRGFLEDYDDKVIIDEAQNAPELFSYIQGIVDESRKTGQFILTGSRNFLLHERISQSLAGRAYVSQLLPLSLSESRKKYRLGLYASIWKGGYPGIYDKKIDPTDFFPSYVQTYLERDVRNVIRVRDLSLFSTFLKICASRIGQEFNSSKIALETSVDHKTVAAWISLLEASYVIFRLPPWHVNFNKRITKSPKLYFYDTGLACYLLGIKSAAEIKVHFAKGPLFENFVISEYLKDCRNKGQVESAYFWRNNSGHEIDMLINTGRDLEIFEFKSSQTIRDDFFKGLNYFEKLAEKYKVQKNLIYAGNEKRRQLGTKVMPWHDMKF